ncbi:MAG: hypothetical protein LUE93_16995 [Bacteroides sp.]|nr:hypothetical protein [Bacteroides sp.]
MYANLSQRIAVFDNPDHWEYQAFHQLAAGKIEEVSRTLENMPPKNGKTGHYQPYFLYELMLKSFDCLLFDKKEEGKKVATAFYHYARIVKPQVVENLKTSPFPTDVWRSNTKDLIHGHMFAFLYDFSYNYMSPRQRDYVRDLLVLSTQGLTTMGMLIPPYFVNWNWCAVGQSHTLNVLAIEGEKGYDPCVYEKSAEVMRHYLTYGIDKYGTSTEAVGYTQFGFKWGAPAMIAISRRGDLQLAHPHFKAMKNWLFYSLSPSGGRYNSRGDGGDGGPSIVQLMVMKYFYPDDPVIDYLFQDFEQHTASNLYKGTFDLITPLICASDATPTDYQYGKAFHLPLTFYDEERGMVISRNAWNKEATVFHLEARADPLGGNHDHADRGTFTLESGGRAWSLDGFRAVDSKFHNIVTINGRGQSFFTPQATWVKMVDKPEVTWSVIDQKYAYDYWWPKPMVAATQPDDPRLETPRYASFQKEIEEFRRLYGEDSGEPDPSPQIVAHFEGNEKGNPRIWDEDPRPYRLPYNPVEYAWRTAGFIKGEKPYVFLVDDIRKDQKEYMYEWNMMVEWDLTIHSITHNDIILMEDKDISKNPRAFRANSRNLQKGEPILLIRVLDRSLKQPPAYVENLAIRLEIVEKHESANGYGHTYGLAKRVVVPALTDQPDFKILLFPLLAGDELPETTWDEEKAVLTIQYGNQTDVYRFTPTREGRNEITMSRNGQKIIE